MAKKKRSQPIGGVKTPDGISVNDWKPKPADDDVHRDIDYKRSRTPGLVKRAEALKAQADSMNREAKAVRNGEIQAYGYSTTEGELLDWTSPDVKVPGRVAESAPDAITVDVKVGGKPTQLVVRKLPARRGATRKIRRTYDVEISFCQERDCGAQLQPSGHCPNGCNR